MIEPIDIKQANNTGVSVGTSSTPLVSDNSDRKGLILVNDGANVVYLWLMTKTGDSLAQAGKGIRLNPLGGSNQYDISSEWKGAIAAIAVVGTSNVTVCELF